MKANGILVFVAWIWSTAVAQPQNVAPLRTAHELVTHHHILINCQPDRVWPYILDISTWKKGDRFEHVSGEKDAVGETFAALPRDGSGQPDYFVQTVELVPYQRRTIKLYGTRPDAPLIGYASWELESYDGMSRLSYHVYTETRLTLDAVAGRTPLELEASQKNYVSENSARFMEELQGLKALLERTPKLTRE